VGGALHSGAVSAPRLAAILSSILLAGALRAGAESTIVLPLPDRFEEIAATTYDQDTGDAVGGGFIRFERRTDGQVRMEGATGIDGGAHTRVFAELAERPGGGLRLLRQESRSVDVSGQPMGVLEIDHVAGEGRGTGDPSAGSGRATGAASAAVADRHAATRKAAVRMFDPQAAVYASERAIP